MTSMNNSLPTSGQASKYTAVSPHKRIARRSSSSGVAMAPTTVAPLVPAPKLPTAPVALFSPTASTSSSSTALRAFLDPCTPSPPDPVSKSTEAQNPDPALALALNPPTPPPQPELLDSNSSTYILELMPPLQPTASPTVPRAFPGPNTAPLLDLDSTSTSLPQSATTGSLFSTPGRTLPPPLTGLFYPMPVQYPASGIFQHPVISPIPVGVSPTAYPAMPTGGIPAAFAPVPNALATVTSEAPGSPCGRAGLQSISIPRPDSPSVPPRSSNPFL
nr:PREDICTED: ras-associated and pleckstrin homology domains-containing protein 1-like [Latimeria chalumnae]|eukprot:XP_006014244.2 PREDICTED: ras-associated and pleckstrin homology domains-containing protein 1-like [Latimeria chalumnae]